MSTFISVPGSTLSSVSTPSDHSGGQFNSKSGDFDATKVAEEGRDDAIRTSNTREIRHVDELAVGSKEEGPRDAIPGKSTSRYRCCFL